MATIIADDFKTLGNCYAAAFYENSDKSLKTNIFPITTSDNIPLLKQFNWKEDGTLSYGLIAQELEDMGYPELVDNKNSVKTVNYSAALSLIVGKLHNKINELELSNLHLQKRIEELENKLK